MVARDITTIQVTKETRGKLVVLKEELHAPDFEHTIHALLNCYRETHGWSTIAVAEELKKLGKETDEV